MKILLFSTLYPDSTRPGHGIFVETRLRQLLATGEVECKVVAPVPWFPYKNKIFGEYSRYAAVPKRETWNQIEVIHPRFPVIPKFGMTVAPIFMAMSVIRLLHKILNSGYDFDIIDAHYFYPDGVAAAILGKLLDKPVVITARGTDLNLIPAYRIPRKMIQWAAAESKYLITVCKALKDVLVNLEVQDSKIHVLRNGVDLERFSPPKNRTKLRKELKISGKTILSVGYLVPRKGHDLVIRTLQSNPDINLIIIGDGPDKRKLLKLARETGVYARVKFTGPMEQSRLKKYYGASDILVLASSREGWANVLLESMACGTPVIATKVWGTPEIVAAHEAGLLVEERTVADIAATIKKLFCDYPDRKKTRRYAEKFGWEATTQGQLSLFNKILSEKH